MKGQVNTKYKSRLAEDFESVEIESEVKEKLIKADTPDIARQILNDAYNNVLLQIRVGATDVFKVVNIYIDYLKTPQYIRLSQRQFDMDIDTSQVLEFPEYICQEILHTLVKLLLENYSDAGVQQEQQGSRR